jgi:hypothetical protein
VTPAEAAAVLGVEPGATVAEIRAAYRASIRVHHPDRAGAGSEDRAARIIAAYRLLVTAPADGQVPPPPTPGAPSPPPRAAPPRPAAAPAVHRIDADTLHLDAPADETFRWLLDAAHDVGEITYVDRSMPIMEVLCRFEQEPATSLLLTLQGRGEGTEVFATVESIEARPAPPTAAVVDLLELALHRRHHRSPDDQSSRSSGSSRSE